MALILGIETSTAICSVALCRNEEILFSKTITEGFNHSENLTVIIRDALASASVSVKDLDAVAVSSGPGSYTGLRIGVSTAKGLCYAADKPLIAIRTLDSLAFALKDKFGDAVLCPMIDARRMEVYTAFYDSAANRLSDDKAVVIDSSFAADKTKVILFGDGSAKCKSVLTDEKFHFEKVECNAELICQLAMQKFLKSAFENVALFEPHYLKEWGEVT